MSALMIQGCGSDVGKSVLVAGLCRLFTNRGLKVRPFKSQNMSNNAAVTEDGEIGRAQALQALACRAVPGVDMNPILLKPQSDLGAQLIVRGRMAGVLDASAHGQDKSALLAIALESYRRLAHQAQLMIIEGAGSPAETNLRRHDIANMGLAEALDLPVILVGDIDRGHVIAALVGAHVVLGSSDRKRIRGFIVNKFRGAESLFADGVRDIVSHTGWPCIGVVPWLPAASCLPSEDGVQLQRSARNARAEARLRIAIPLLSRIANFDEFDALLREPDVEVLFVPPGRPLPPDAALVILAGTKATIAELKFIRAQGWDIDLHAHVRRGGRVLGICGGYQMLGRLINDPQGVEGMPAAVPGLGLLEIETVMTSAKTLREVSGAVLEDLSGRAPDPGVTFTGYEMHVGLTSGRGLARPFLRLDGGALDGAVSADSRVAGCYVHGLFGSTATRSMLIGALGAAPAREEHGTAVDAALDEIAVTLESCLDIDALMRIAGVGTGSAAERVPA